MKKLLIMAAGTGGHIFPGLAIADTMRARGWHVSWLGTSHGMECDLVPRHGIAMDTITFSGLRGKGAMHTVKGVFRMAASFFVCRSILARRNPDVVLGMGGYVTVPGGFMAKMRGIPLVLINADAALMLSNKTLASSAQRVLFGFPADFGAAADKAIVTGNPVRAEIATLPAPAQRYADRSGPLKVLVVGGSLGAKALNDTLPAALALIPEAQRPVVTHQSGKKNIDALRANYTQANVRAEVVDFIDDMPRRYAEADLVICRAGALTVSELAAAGLPSLLVPLPHAIDDHQTRNAQYLAREGAALLLPQHATDADALAAQLTEVLMHPDKLKAMGRIARSLAKPDATRSVVDICLEVARG